jgi:predicted TIM-barrel fold metal-dependent hydrolase
MSSDQRRQNAEKTFKHEVRGRNARKAMTEHETRSQAVRENMARLKALRLAKEAQALTEESAKLPVKTGRIETRRTK